MRILVFSPYYPPHRGGLETHSDEFNKYLAEQGTEITVFTPLLPVDAPTQETRYPGVKVIRFPAVELIHNYPFPCFWQKEFWSLWKNLSHSSPNLVISRTRFFFPSLMAGYWAWRHHLPWIHIEHGSGFAEFNHPLKNKLGKLYDLTFGKLVLKQAHSLIANSEASRDFVHRLSGRSDCQVIYRGVEKEAIESAPINDSLRKQYPGKILIGYIGRLIEGKGLKDLLVAFQKIENQNALLIILGDGPEKEKLFQLAKKLKISEQVIFLGAHSFSEAMGHLKSYDIFVNPSYTEGIPTSVIEAALLRKAIIATHVGGTQEIITGQHDGLLVPARDPEKLAESLTALLSNPELRKALGEEAYKRVSERFTWNEASKTYLDFFTTFLEKTRP